MHPGGLVATPTCSSGPGPGPAPAPSAKQYLWGVPAASAGTGWAMGAVGVAAPITHGPSGMCIDAEADGAAKQGKELELVKCNGGDSQLFLLESNGNLHSTKTTTKLCLAIEDFEGAGVVGFNCNAGENEEFIFDATKKTICSKGDSSHVARCLDAKSTTPGGGGGGGGLQIWAKPQPAGATAVLVINGGDSTCGGVHIDFAAVRFDSSLGDSKMKDIWNKGAVTKLKAGATSFTTDSIASHDSRFYLFSRQVRK